MEMNRINYIRRQSIYLMRYRKCGDSKTNVQHGCSFYIHIENTLSEHAHCNTIFRLSLRPLFPLTISIFFVTHPDHPSTTTTTIATDADAERTHQEYIEKIRIICDCPHIHSKLYGKTVKATARETPKRNK